MRSRLGSASAANVSVTVYICLMRHISVKLRMLQRDFAVWIRCRSGQRSRQSAASDSAWWAQLVPTPASLSLLGVSELLRTRGPSSIWAQP
jgi:hypothetical protein